MERFRLKGKKTLIAINRFNKRNVHFVLNRNGDLMDIKELNVLIFKVGIILLIVRRQKFVCAQIEYYLSE